jgi:hypothetical protein
MVCSRLATGWAAATCASCRSTLAIRTSSARTSSTTSAEVWRSTSGKSVAGSSRIAVTRRSTVRAPTGIEVTVLAQQAAQRVDRATRAVCHWVWTRCKACTVCCSTLFTGTGWMSAPRGFE